MLPQLIETFKGLFASLEIKLLGFEIPLGTTIKNLCFIDLFGIAISI